LIFTGQERPISVPTKLIKILIAAAALTGLFFWGRNLRSDLNLVELSGKASKSANWELGDIETTRIVGKDTWEIEAKKVIRRHPVDHLTRISAKISGPSGVRTVYAPNGSYNSRRNELVLRKAKGVWKRPQYPMSWKTPLARWTQKGDRWDFPKGVTISGDVYSMECESAHMSGQKDVHAINGCIRWWN